MAAASSVWRCGKRGARPMAGLVLGLILGLTLTRWDPVAAQDVKPAEKPDAADAVSAADLQRIYAGGSPAGLAELKAMGKWQQTLAEQLIPSTVAVRIGAAQGSGVIVDDQGHILTAAHVAQQPDLDCVVIFPDGKQARGRTLGMNRDIDAGMVRLDLEDAKRRGIRVVPAQMGSSKELSAGQWCLVTGHPGGYQPGRRPVVRVGRILASYQSVIVTDCPLVGGDSGGPLFDMQEKVIGIHSRIGGALTANMHVPVGTYTDTWDRLAAGEIWGRVPSGAPYIGVEGAADADVAKIARVTPEGPAAEAGMQADDVIIRFAGSDVESFRDLVRIVARQRPGKKVKVVVRRGEKEVELEMTIGRKD